jgi:putative endonuclease
LEKILGREGEQLVADYLTTKGCTLLAQNYTYRRGEIDIIAAQGDTLLFIEVKLRCGDYFPLSEVITLNKQRVLVRTALHYIALHGIQNMIYRFDVALIKKEESKYRLMYIPNAFTAELW